jgi:hypothetical protein
MDGPNSPGRRTLLKAGALTLATPVIGAVAQPAPSHQEAVTFNLWVISDSHVGTDKAASEGIQHGLVGFKPPPVYFESLARASIPPSDRIRSTAPGSVIRSRSGTFGS